jgi:mRNA interferase MazF
MPGKVSRGSVVDVNLDPSVGREIMKTRPCVVVQNDIGNRHSQLTIVAAMTGAENILQKAPPIWILVAKGDGGIDKDSYVLCNQIRTVDETRLGKIYGTLSKEVMEKVDRAIRISLSLL